MAGSIRHIGKGEPKDTSARLKRLVQSGIFRDKDTHHKLIDCQGDFETWTNAPAKDWINARVKELREERQVNIGCECCHSRDPQFLKDEQEGKHSLSGVNEDCYGDEIVELIKRLAAEE